jgi:8-oxo-dGTP pyrophosphatase MutT (NUDIX family)
MRTIHRVIAAGLIFSKDGKLLMGKKDPESGGVYADCWHLPGGGVNEDETYEEALRREIAEEVGIDIASADITLADDKGTGQSEKTLQDTGEKVICNMLFNVYQVDLQENAADIDLGAGDDLVVLEWIDPKGLPDYTVTPPSKKLFKRLGWL